MTAPTRTPPRPDPRPNPRPSPRPQPRPSGERSPDLIARLRAQRGSDGRPVPGAPPLTLGRVRDPERPWPGRRRNRPGEQSAGQVLVVTVMALVLAALVNADALVERAERKPLGTDRDRSLYLWHPVQDISHLTQLYRIRQLGDWLAGNEDRGGRVAPTAPPAETGLVVEPPELRFPTADDPLRVFVGGDSVVRDAGESLLRLAADDPRLAATLHYEIATGLARPDFFDWAGALVADMEEHRPELAIIMFGGNDAQGIVGPDGTVHASVTEPGWAEEYGRRVGNVMDTLRAEDRLVLWIGQPPMRDRGFDRRIQVLNDVFEEQAEDRPWVRFIDSGTILGDDGRYADRLPDGAGGVTEDLRQDDGIHLSRAGADRLARHLLGIVDAEIAAVAPAPTTTAKASGDG